MTALKIIAAVVVVLLLLGFIRVGGRAEYHAGGLIVTLRVMGIPIRIFPQKPKKKGKKKRTEKKAAKAGKKPVARERKEPSGGTVRLLLTLLPDILDMLGRLSRHIRIQPLEIDYTVPGGEDAAAAAIQYGRLSAACGGVLPLIENHFDVRQRRVRLGVDFQAQEPVIAVRAGLSISLGRLLAIALRFCVRAVKAMGKTEKKPQGQAVSGK